MAWQNVVRRIPTVSERAGTGTPERVMRQPFGRALRLVRVEARSTAADDRPTEEITIVYTKVEFEIFEASCSE